MRFPSYSSEWHSYTLGEILTFYSTNSFSREKLNYDSGSVKNIHYGDIHTKFSSIVSISNNKDIPFINNEIDLSKYSEDQYLQNGDLIIADASEDYEDIGKAIEVKNINDEKVLAGLHTILARDNNNITVNGFKAYLFSTNSLKTKIKIIANGISVLGISKNNLSKLTVNVPSKNEQNDVVDFISLIDNKIELLEQKHQYYQEFKKFLMQQIFAQKLRFDFENDWDLIKLEEISDIKTGKKDVKDSVDGGAYPFFVRSAKIESINSYSYDGEAILIPGDGKIGEVYHYINGKFDYHQRVYKISDFNENILGKYVYYYLQKNFLKHALRNTAKATVDSLRLPIVKSMEINYPSLQEQNKIVNILDNVENKLQYVQNQIFEIENFKKGLLQQMFVVRINWRCNFKLVKSPSFNKHLLILKNKIIFIIIK